MRKTFCQVARNSFFVALLLATGLAVWAGPLGFSSSVSAALIDQYVSRFGTEARGRLLGWKGLLKGRGSESRPERDLAYLTVVNGYFNRVRYLTDLEHWGATDYWATPAETVGSNGGDCEDYAIAKYFALKELGVPITRMRITYVMSSRIKEAHMVLAYYPTPQSDPLILDNLEPQIRPASERPDLVAVYGFSDEDALTAGGSRAFRQVRSWRELVDRLERESSI